MTTTTHLMLAGPLLALVAWRDLAARLLPDGPALALLGIGIAARAPLGWDALLQSLGAAALLFVVLLAAATRGWLGGGDVKLAGAIAVGLEPAVAWSFVWWTSIAGAGLALPYLLARRLSPAVPSLAPRAALPRRWAAIEARRLVRGGPLPYAVAIAAGAVLAIGGW
jgi:prepilin peptidase CpaA